MRRFRLIVCGWLRFAGRLHEPDRAPGPHQSEVDAYCRCMGEERGLSPATIATARHHLKHFFAETPKRRLTQHTIAHIEHYLAGLGERLDAQRNSYPCVPPTWVLSLCRKPKMEKTWTWSSHPGAAHISEGAAAHGALVARCATAVG